MEDTLSSWLLKHYPTIFFMAFAAIVSIIITVKYMKFIKRLSSVEKTCGDLSGIHEDIKIMIKTNTIIETKIDEVILPKISEFDKDIKSLIIHSKQYIDNNDSMIKSNSPLSITDVGHEILVVSGGKKYVDDNKDFLFEEIRKLNSINELDIENYSYYLLVSNYMSPAYSEVKSFLYNNPKYITSSGVEVLLDEKKLARLIGLYLRDLYIKATPLISSKLL